MVSDIGALLVEIDKKSFDIYKSFCSEVRNPFRFDNRHRTLDEFSEALELYERLEEMLNSGTNPSSFESDIVCAFYSALAFRIVDSSLYYDKDKFDKAEQILKRAEKISSSVGTNLHRAKSKIEWKKASCSSAIVENSWGYGKSIYHILRYTFLTETFNLIGSTKALAEFYYQQRINFEDKRSLSTIIKSDYKQSLKYVYEIGRGIAFTFSVIIGIGGIYNDYRLALAGFGAATAIPLSRYLYRKRKTEQLIGYSNKIPKIKAV